MFRLLLLSSFCISFVFGNNVQLVPLANKSIDYKSKIYSQDVRMVQVNEKYKCKEYLDLITLKKNKYYAKHYIAKDRVICAHNVFVPELNKVKFKFGNLEIEKEAELIQETNSYIKIKNVDGTIEKIYTDGRIN
ncbi:MAG: hypothetical protein WA945_07910 [Arcobacteraceae bacterium]